MKFKFDQTMILDFDIECRPLSWISSDFVTSEVTAIAASFGKDDITCWLLGRETSQEMLTGFHHFYKMADIVTGHYIRAFDLPRINGAMLDFHLPPLGPKLTSDTKSDLLRVGGISKSQESLAEMLGLPQSKIGMSQQSWRMANRLERVDLTEGRVVADVRQHQALRAELISRNMLGASRLWHPVSEGE